jgi:putative toxin 3FTx-tel4
VLGRPSQDDGGKLLWENKAAAKVAEIEPDGEKVGRIICY